MSDLAGFLAARLGEQRERAWAVHDVGKCDAMLYAENMENYARDQPDCDCGHPARVLREVEAKRKILADYQAELVASTDDKRREPDLERYLERTVKVLASAYAGHPDYDPAWPAALKSSRDGI